jgi:hypothetical protein
MDINHVINTLKNPPITGRADLRQDILALALTDFKQGGYFVEFGALDGITGSNTYILEKNYGWTGIVAEAARVWKDKVQSNRSCVCDFRAVAAHSGQNLTFKETDVQLGLSGLIDFFDEKEYHARRRAASSGAHYKVSTVSLNDLLDEHDAPNYIDYISIDTEGSEPAILSTFDFRRRRVGLWTIEHNYFDRARNQMLEIMTANGYQRLLPKLSTIDDWYIPA